MTVSPADSDVLLARLPKSESLVLRDHLLAEVIRVTDGDDSPTPILKRGALGSVVLRDLRPVMDRTVH